MQYNALATSICQVFKKMYKGVKWNVRHWLSYVFSASFVYKYNVTSLQ